MKTCIAVFGVPFVVVMILLWSCIMNNVVYRLVPSMIPQNGVRQFELIPGLLLLMDLGLIGFCRTAKKMIFGHKDLEVPLLYHPGEDERRTLMIFMTLLYPVMFMTLVLAASFWLHTKLVYNKKLKQFTDRQCVEVDAARPVFYGLLEERVRSVTPIEGYNGEKLLNETPGGEDEFFKRRLINFFSCGFYEYYYGYECKRCAEKKKRGQETMQGGGITTWPTKTTKGLKYNYEGYSMPEFSPECAEEMNDLKGEGKNPILADGTARPSSVHDLIDVTGDDHEDKDDEGYMRVQLASYSFQGREKARIKVHKSYANVPEALMQKPPETTESEAPLLSGDGTESSTELLPGVSPSAFVYRLSNVYDDFPDAKVGRLNLNVPTVRPRIAPGLDEEKSYGSDMAVNPIKPDVVCRDIPGLNWYMPGTVIEVPKKNLGYQYAGMFSTILSSQKKARYQYVLSRVITVVSIFGLAIVAEVQDSSKAAMAKAEDQAMKEAKKMEKAAENGQQNIFTPVVNLMHDAEQFGKDLMEYWFPTTALEQMLLLCIQPGLELSPRSAPHPSSFAAHR